MRSELATPRHPYRTAAFFLLALMLALSALAREPVKLYPMQKGGEWGYISADGEWAIGPQYFRVQPFSQGLAGVQRQRGGAWGYINAEGEFVLKPQFTIAQAQFYANCDGLPGDAAVRPFSNGLAAVRKDGKLLVINKTGEVQFTVDQYDKLWGFADNGLARVRVGGPVSGNYGYISRNGEIVIEPQFEEAGDFSGGLAPVQKRFSSDFGYINAEGEWVLKPRFEEAGEFSAGLAPAATNAFSWTFINKNGQATLDHPFEQDIHAISGGLAAVEDHNGWYYITPDGDKAINRTNNGRILCYALPFRAGLARVYLPPQGESCKGWSRSGSFLRVHDTLMTYIDKQGNVIHQEPVSALRARQARRKAQAAAEAKRERQEEEREASREQQQLAGCRDFVSHGDPTLPNMLEISYKGVVRRFYFQHAAVEINKNMRGNNSYTVFVPALRAASADGLFANGFEILGIRIEPAFGHPDKLTAELRGYRTSPTFCIEFPTAVGDSFDSDSTADILRWTPPSEGQDGVWKAKFKITSDEHANSYLKGRFRITNIFMPSGNAPVANPGFYMADGDRKAIDETTITYKPEAGTLKAKVHLKSGAFQYDSISITNSVTGRYVETISSIEEDPEYLLVYDVVAFEDALVHYRKYVVEVPEGFSATGQGRWSRVATLLICADTRPSISSRAGNQVPRDQGQGADVQP